MNARPSALFKIRDRWSGRRIANANGVPGTLGCLAHTRRDQRLIALTTHHVLFGAGAKEQDVVWLIESVDHGAGAFRLLGRTAFGRLGTVRFEDADVFIDCAAVALDEESIDTAGCHGAEEPMVSTAVAPGAHVTKTGGATGTTAGVVLDVAHTDRALVNGCEQDAPGQILVRALEPGARFSAEGDSGAVLCDAHGAVVGLLWGVTPRGDALVCPIAPVLYLLQLTLARVEPYAGAEAERRAVVS